MKVIRIPEKHWGRVWHELIASGPISRISHEPVYVVSDRQVRLRRRKKLPFKLISPSILTSLPATRPPGHQP